MPNPELVRSAHRAGIFKRRNPARFAAYVFGTEHRIKARRAEKRRRARRRGKR